MEDGSVLIGFLLGVLGGLIANYLSPPFAKIVSQSLGFLVNLVNPERFDLAGVWQQTFDEPDPAKPSVRRTETERVQLSHIGSVLTGVGKTTVQPRDFSCDLRVSHSMVFGAYKKVGRQGSLTGQGMVQLIVNASRTEMIGCATWYDQDTDKIESASVKWLRV
ncbi:hypothetical protein PSUB009319_20630 [Ralstonia sp. SET104]|nr:hypothetical protein PSUB009319_20630 [Ralstonia sp. SET104]